MKKREFPVIFDDVCRECTFDIDRDKLGEHEKLLFDLMEKTHDTPVKCIVCQLRTTIVMNGDGSNTLKLLEWGWAQLKEN